MTYNVFGGTLNPTLLPVSQCVTVYASGLVGVCVGEWAKFHLQFALHTNQVFSILLDGQSISLLYAQYSYYCSVNILTLCNVLYTL